MMEANQAVTQPVRTPLQHGKHRAGDFANTLPADATAADHLVVRVAVVQSDASARQAREATLVHPGRAEVYVTDREGRLCGVLPVSSFIGLADDAAIDPYVKPPPGSISASQDQEEVALTAIRLKTNALPVHDDAGRFLGVVEAFDLLRVLHHEHVEDLDRLSGVMRQTEHAVHALEEPPSRQTRERLPWLLVGLAGSVLATFVTVLFEDSLRRHLAVAFFVPAIVYLADAIGTQTEAIVVRGLAYRHRPVRALLLDELCTGLFLGLILALPVLPLVWWVFGSRELALAVATALVTASTLATALGLAFPVLLTKFGKDPALGSGPLATVVQDVMSLLAYFVAVRVFLG
jgi:magnesium transporter